MRNLILPLLLVSLTATAKTKFDISELAEVNERPNMFAILPVAEEVTFPRGIPVGPEWAQENGYDQRLDIKTWTKLLINRAPHLIAQFEKVYPGGKWVFIGRDAAAFADVFEAFYASIGQYDRVMRLGVSKASFSNIKVDYIIKMLADAGYNVDNYKHEAPLLFVDPVSKGNGRQGRQLVAMLYDYLIKHFGAKPKHLVTKINMLGLIVSTHGGGYHSVNDPETYYAQYKQTFKAEAPAYATIFNNHIFMSVDEETTNLSNESGYTHFIGAWNDSYGPFQREQGGRTRPQTGQPFQKELRMSILWTQAQIWKAIKSGKFLEAVKKEAKKLGYVFPNNECEQELRRAS